MGMNQGDDSDRSQKLFERIAEEVAKLASKKALEQTKQKIVEALVEALPVVAAVIGVVLLIFAMVGAVITFKNALYDKFEEKYSSMTEEEIDTYLDDPENIYACLSGQSGALLSADDVYNAFSPAGLAMLDRATTYEIFKQIHDYNQRRAQELSISYTIRHETREGDVPDIDDSLNLESENFGNNEDSESDYSSQEYRTIMRAEVEKDIDDNGRDIFALRWQPIYATLAIAAAENNGYWGQEASDTFETGELETKDIGTYYLTSAQIQQVIDIFYLRSDYYYDALGDLSFTSYQFLDMEKNTSAFKVETHDWTETKTDDMGQKHTIYHRISKRIPYSAPNIIKNGFEMYEYGYTGISTNGKDQKCANRKYDAVASKLLAAVQPFSPTMIESLDESGLQFEATNFILLFDEYLQLLPDPDGELHDFYIDKLLNPYMEGDMASHIEKFVTTEANCPSIGVIFSPGSDAVADEPLKDFSDPNLIIEEVNISIPGAQSADIVWVSDLHIVMDESGTTSAGLDVAKRYEEFVQASTGTHSKDTWQTIINYINEHDFDAAIFGGDMMDYCSEKNLDAIREGMNSINIDKMYIRADHDYNYYVGDGFDSSDAKKGHERIDGNQQKNKILHFDGFDIVGVDFSQTQMSSDTFSWITDKYNGAKKVITVTHVPYASKTDNSLESLSKSFRQGRVYYWADNSANYYPNGATREYLNNLIYSDETKSAYVLAGHLHTTWEGNITTKLRQHIFGPAYEGHVGVIHVNRRQGGATIEDMDYSGTGVLFSDYINGSTKRLMPLEGVDGKYSKRDTGAPLAEYKVNAGANRNITTSGNYTEEQIYQMLANSPVKTGKTSSKYAIYNGKDPRFACESAMRAVAHAMYEWQGSNSMDVAAFMAISRKEGIGSLTPTADYNFVNQVANKSMIAKGYYHPVTTTSEGVHNFASYKNQACDEWYRETYGATLTKSGNSGEQNRNILENYFSGLTQAQREKVLARAVKLNLTKLYDLWCVNRARTNFKEFIFSKSYKAGDWSSLTLCYCPPYSNDFPFRGKENSAAGWANGCGTYLEEYRSLAGK